MEPIAVEVGVDMLDRVETHTVHLRHTLVPGAPLAELLYDLRILVINVSSHQVVEVAEFVVNIRTPLVIFKFVDRAALRFLVAEA